MAPAPAVPERLQPPPEQENATAPPPAPRRPSVRNFVLAVPEVIPDPPKASFTLPLELNDEQAPKDAPRLGGKNASSGQSLGNESLSTLSSSAFRARQSAKSWMAAVVVLFAMTACVLVLYKASLDFEEPVCEGDEYRRCCEPCGTGTSILPLFGEWEKSWPWWVHSLLYFVGLIWVFLGVGIVCDQFVAAIEEITVAESTWWVEIHKGSWRKFHTKIWNGTIANLSLMALGSSAPEILLSATELMADGFYAGKLGPSTIVGSAAFNLLMISSVCVSALPAGVTKQIESLEVFAVTTSISIFAYLWLVVILLVNSPHRVDLEESIATLLMFPALLLLAYMADRGWLFAPCKRRLDHKATFSEHAQQIQERLGQLMPQKVLRKMVTAQIAGEQKPCASRATLRRSATATLTGGSKHNMLDLPSVDARTAGRELILGFQEEQYQVLGCTGVLKVTVVANREPGVHLEMRYHTREGSAKRDLRYRHVEGSLTFGPRQLQSHISIPIVDSAEWDPQEEFYVEIEGLQTSKYISQQPSENGAVAGVGHSASCSRTPSFSADLRLGVQTTVVTVLKTERPGTLSFDADEVMAFAGTTATLGIVRSGGSRGRICCTYEARDDTAVGGRHFTPVRGTLSFDCGETHKTIEIPILAATRGVWEEMDLLKVILCDASEGVKFDANMDGGESCAVCDVLIASKAHSCFLVAMLRRLFPPDQTRNSMQQWKEQFTAAFYCNGDPEEQAKASYYDWFFHYLTLLWKVLFAFVPPPALCGGWPCFVAALGMIGATTAAVGELAKLLGCSLGIDDLVTAVTLIALGTSVPDTFASRAAVQQEDTADNAIGNIMGSNSVNVFLGLGISWTMGAAYWHQHGPTDEWRARTHDGRTYEELFIRDYPSGGFMYPAGKTFLLSVCIYVACAMVCIAVLVVRRYKYGGELGGPARAQCRDSLLLALLWVIYIAASVAVASL